MWLTSSIGVRMAPWLMLPGPLIHLKAGSITDGVDLRECGRHLQVPDVQAHTKTAEMLFTQSIALALAFLFSAGTAAPTTDLIAQPVERTQCAKQIHFVR